MTSLIKENVSLWLSQKYGSIQAATLEKELRAIHLELQTSVVELVETPKPNSIVIHFLKPGHTYSNQTTPPNSATLYGLSSQTHAVFCGKEGHSYSNHHNRPYFPFWVQVTSVKTIFLSSSIHSSANFIVLFFKQLSTTLWCIMYVFLIHPSVQDN